MPAVPLHNCGGRLIAVSAALAALIADVEGHGRGDAAHDAFLMDACAIAQTDAARQAPASGWSRTLESTELRLVLAKALPLRRFPKMLALHLPVLDYHQYAWIQSIAGSSKNFTSPGSLDSPVCAVGLLAVTLVLSILGTPEDLEGLETCANTFVRIVYDLIWTQKSWTAVMRTGWPVFALVAWCSEKLGARLGIHAVGSGNVLRRLASTPARAVMMLKSRLRRRGQLTNVDMLALAPSVWHRLAELERALADGPLLASLAVQPCGEGFFCDRGWSPNRYQCRCQQLFANFATEHVLSERLCLISIHNAPLEEISSLSQLGEAQFWTFTSILNQWYSEMHGGEFHWKLGHDFWCKIRVIREVLASKPRCEWAAWVDSDAYVASGEALQAVAAAHPGANLLMPSLAMGLEEVGAHFMLFRTSPELQAFFDLVWALPDSHPDIAGRFKSERFHDQSVINLLLRGAVPGVHLSGIRLAHLSTEDFAASNARVVVHQGGMKGHLFRRRALHEVLCRVRDCLLCSSNSLWRQLHAEMGNATPDDVLHQFPVGSASDYTGSVSESNGSWTRSP